MTETTPSDPITEHVIAMHRTAAVHTYLALETDDRALLRARMNASIGCYQAARFLWALKQHDPEGAEALAEVVLSECEGGEVLSEATDWAGALGGNPDTWQDDAHEYGKQLALPKREAGRD